MRGLFSKAQPFLICGLILLSGCQRPAPSIHHQATSLEVHHHEPIAHHTILAYVPLSGRLSSYGHETLDGIRLALEAAREHDKIDIDLVVEDSGERVSPQRVQALIDQHKPLAMIGPLLSRNVESIASAVLRWHTPILTPSALLARPRATSPYLYSTAFIPRQQAQAITAYALGEAHYRRVCLFSPETGLGRELGVLVAAAVKEQGGEVPFEGRYADTQADFRDLIRQLKHVPDLAGEKSSVRDVAKRKKGTPFPVACDAIFLAGDYRQAILLASQLRFHDVHVPIIGNNSWVSGDLQHFPEAALVGAVFVDSFSPEAPDATARNFVAAYRKAKPSVPSAFAAQAYDATAAVIDAIRNGAKSPSDVHAHLWHADDLPGLAGPMHFDSDGLLQRPATLNKVKGGGKIEFLRRVRPSAATPSVVSAR